ncbi:hypothetical protein RJZ57_004355 [Blastomyces gilchristii]
MVSSSSTGPGTTRIADAQLSLRYGTLGGGNDEEYHPGGIDYDGRHIGMTICAVRGRVPRRAVVRVDAWSLRAETHFAYGGCCGLGIWMVMVMVYGYGYGWSGGNGGVPGFAAFAKPSEKIRSPEFLH